ncbi:Hypothetical predicted protein [Paramuricea clavata]|uniref:Uncharacterized protein n=1 Tax=Paramuricea clavata TaxID=317549 RepID=A0A7D9EQX0_PARCT|nr:Hypothetical predicted protein [Paramuricea clavata]
MSTTNLQSKHKQSDSVMEEGEQNEALNFIQPSTSKKGKLSGFERNKRWREKKGSDFKKVESARVEKIRKNRIAQMSPTELNKYKMAACERKRKSRMLKKQKEMENAGSSLTETVGSSSMHANGN